jgi:hypothetical protein
MGSTDFADMRPRLHLLMELYRNAATDEARTTLLALCEDVFLATAWNVAVDLLENGWEPAALPPPTGGRARLRVVS